ncbi:oxidoreductase [Aureococcus anophagefferens]|nr:oxidoreductase [Aureococcus anophagefferens]
MALPDLVKGVLSNGIAGALLYAVATSLDLATYVKVALAVQYGVYLVHGLPCKSERFYDLRRRGRRGQIAVAIAGIVWCCRLGTFLFLRIEKDGRDERFDSLKKHALRFLGAWTIQALWVSLVQLPVVLVNDRVDDAPLGPVDAALAAIWCASFILETLADVQKFVWRCDPANKGKFITVGLWRYARQPNYFGEIFMWLALAAVATNAAAGADDFKRVVWSFGSPAFTALLLLCVSGLPMVDRASMKKWGDDPAYLHYVKHTSSVVPWKPAPAFSKEAAPKKAKAAAAAATPVRRNPARAAKSAAKAE